MILKINSKDERRVLISALADFRDNSLSKHSFENYVTAQLLIGRIK